MRQPIYPFLAAAVLLMLIGCGSSDPYGRQPVAGTITFRGIALNQGVIDFLPVEPKDASGARGMIQDGTYRIPMHQGLAPGTYRVLISSPEANTTEEPVGPPGMKMPPLGKERIPAKYNRDSKVNVEVKASGENRFDYSIE